MDLCFLVKYSSKHLQYSEWVTLTLFLLVHLCNLISALSDSRHFNCTAQFESKPLISLCCSTAPTWSICGFHCCSFHSNILHSHSAVCVCFSFHISIPCRFLLDWWPCHLFNESPVKPIRTTVNEVDEYAESLLRKYQAHCLPCSSFLFGKDLDQLFVCAFCVLLNNLIHPVGFSCLKFSLEGNWLMQWHYSLEFSHCIYLQPPP